MIEVPIEDMLEKTGSIFKLVMLAAKRTSELNEGYKPHVEVTKNKKNAAIALKEIALGKIKFTLNG
jgi:DNA-directed RNA polymerase, omega subunit